MPDNRAFSFGEGEVWAKPAGLNSVSVGFASSYNLDRRSVEVEDGSVSFFEDTLRIESPWVDSDIVTLFEATSKFDFAYVRWLNADDARLQSVSVTDARLTGRVKRPGDGMVETASFTFEALGLK